MTANPIIQWLIKKVNTISLSTTSAHQTFFLLLDIIKNDKTDATLFSIRYTQEPGFPRWLIQAQRLK